MGPHPPNRALRFLRWFCREDYLEEIEGDLTEIFKKHYEDSPLKARWKFAWSVISYFRPEFIKSFKNFYRPDPYGMYKSYFKIGWRSLLKNKGYSLINIGGLALGLTCFMVILLYVQHEFSFNRFYENVAHIYRVYQRQTGNAARGTDYFAVTPAQLASVMREEFPEVVSATSVKQSLGLLSVGGQHFWEKGLAGDAQFFDVFTLSFIEGTSKTALADSKSIVLTRSLAQTIFGDKSPLGQPLSVRDEGGYHVTAVIDDPPYSSSLQYSFIVNILSSGEYRQDMKNTGWNSNAFHTFFVLSDGADPSSLVKKFSGLIKKYQPEDYVDYPFKAQYFVQPLADMYFQANINSDIGIKGNRRTIYLFSVVALIVLLLACVNYMNLAVARSIKRSREVGLRKVMGAVRRQLVAQFLGESVLIAFLSLVLAIGLTWLLLPYFGQMMERPVELNFLSNPWLLPALLLLVLLVGFFSGSYPAFVISSLRPMEVLKARADVKVSGFSLQRLLIVVQFAVSITLVISSLIIYQQLQYMQRKELGYDKEYVVAIRLIDQSLQDRFELLSNEWSKNQHIISATMSSALPTDITSSSIINNRPGADDKEGLTIYRWSVGHDFMDVFGIRLITGRSFSRDISNDSEQSYLINETAAKALGWTPEEAIGKQIYHGEYKNIIGVVSDFHMYSMHLPIQPLMISLYGNWSNYISVKVKPEGMHETLAYLEKTIKANSPYRFDYQFLDENFEQLYASEMRLGEIFGVFTLVSILIASLGLFGLAAFLSDQRTKEIGIRKVLGASIHSIVLLVSKDFIKLVFIAFMVAIPIGWYAMHSWLQDFAYRVNIEWWTFALAGVLAFFIANLSIGYQSLKASLMDPVDSLKSE